MTYLSPDFFAIDTLTRQNIPFYVTMTNHVLLYSFWEFVYNGGWSSVATAISSVSVHGIGCIFIWVDFLLSAERFYYKATIWACLLGSIFTIWSLIFTAAGLKDQNGNPYIYEAYDWSSGAAKPIGLFFATLAILTVISIIAAFIKNIILISSDIGKTMIRLRNEEKNSTSGSGRPAKDVELDNNENGGTNTQSSYPEI